MFVVDADTTCLRQGDILKGIPFPRLVTGTSTILAKIPGGTGPLSENPTIVALTHEHRGDPEWLTAQFPIRLSYCAVVSQCCDLELRNGRFVMPAFAVARLVPVPKVILENSEKLASLKANKDPRDSEDPGYINFFYVPPHDALDRREWIVDYNQALSIPGSDFPSVLRNKVLQMDDVTRAKFKIKLAASFSRLTEEERKSGHDEPWKLGR